MAGTSGGFPFWELHFDAAGARVAGDEGNALRAKAASGEISDLMVFSHGWNNNHAKARDMYDRFFTQLAEVAGARPGLHVAGVFWPSMMWPGDEPPDPDAGGAASLGDDAEAEAVAALRGFYTEPEQAEALETALALLEARPEDPSALRHFRML